MTQKMVRDFVQKEIAPVIKEYDRKQEPIPFMLKRMGELGILGLPFPVRYGGQGMDFSPGVWPARNSKRGHPPAGGHVGAHGAVRHEHLPVGHRGAEAEVPRAAGKGRKDRMRRLHGTRHGVGCGGDADQSAKRDGDYYILNGEKMWISLASKADLALVTVKTNPSARKPSEGCPPSSLTCTAKA
jgi:glutaryl-CoA dehydrogenase (non-decarboxylating)